ncbi:MAG: hypothetical protein ACYC0X_19820 [Pirellulaceae bacterium]
MKTEQSAGGDLPHEAGFPRRFGVGTLLAVTTMFGVLFAGLQALGCPPIVFFLVILFVTVVGLGQALLFGGQHPRRASVIVGALFFPSMIMLSMLYVRLAGDRYAVTRLGSWVIPVLSSWCILGAMAGYVGGVLVASGFLLIDKVRRRRAMSQARHHDDETDA